jgi:hypothetical protein
LTGQRGDKVFAYRESVFQMDIHRVRAVLGLRFIKQKKGEARDAALRRMPLWSSPGVKVRAGG